MSDREAIKKKLLERRLRDANYLARYARTRAFTELFAYQTWCAIERLQGPATREELRARWDGLSQEHQDKIIEHTAGMLGGWK